MHHLEPQARAIEETCHERRHTVELCQHRLDFCLRQDGGEAARALGAFDVLKVGERLSQDVTVEEQQGVEGAILGRGGHLVMDG